MRAAVRCLTIYSVRVDYVRSRYRTLAVSFTPILLAACGTPIGASAGQTHPSEGDNPTAYGVAMRVVPKGSDAWGLEGKFQSIGAGEDTGGMTMGANLLVNVADPVYALGGAAFGLGGDFSWTVEAGAGVDFIVAGDGSENIALFLEAGYNQLSLSAEGDTDPDPITGPFARVGLSFKFDIMQAMADSSTEESSPSRSTARQPRVVIREIKRPRKAKRPPKADKRCIRGNCKNGTGTYEYGRGASYEGDWRDGKRHGHGTHTYADGAVYRGEWRDGKEHGHGTLSGAGIAYEGEWRNGKMHGQGILTATNGIRYEGQFRDGKRHGRGTLTTRGGTGYKGQWRDGEAHGHGTRTYADGRVYQGEWDDGDFHGHGIYKDSDGGVYEGEWQHGRKSGRGRQTYPDGTVWEGKWLFGERELGTYTYADGSVWDGGWEDDGPNAYGTFTPSAALAKKIARLELSAKAGEAKAQFELARIYGRYHVHLAEARRLLTLAAKQDHKEAVASLGLMHLRGKGGYKNTDAALRWFRRGAKLQNATSQFMLGQLYAAGKGVKSDQAAAVGWYRKAAQQGLVEAQVALGTMYFNAQGTKRNYAEALRLFQLAARDSAVALYNLGVMHEAGLSVPKNCTKAATYYRHAGKKGHPEADDALARLQRAGCKLPNR